MFCQVKFNVVEEEINPKNDKTVCNRILGFLGEQFERQVVIFSNFLNICYSK